MLSFIPGYQIAFPQSHLMIRFNALPGDFYFPNFFEDPLQPVICPVVVR